MSAASSVFSGIRALQSMQWVETAHESLPPLLIERTLSLITQAISFLLSTLEQSALGKQIRRNDSRLYIKLALRNRSTKCDMPTILNFLLFLFLLPILQIVVRMKLMFQQQNNIFLRIFFSALGAQINSLPFSQENGNLFTEKISFNFQLSKWSASFSTILRHPSDSFRIWPR